MLFETYQEIIRDFLQKQTSQEPQSQSQSQTQTQTQQLQILEKRSAIIGQLSLIRRRWREMMELLEQELNQLEKAHCKQLGALQEQKVNARLLLRPRHERITLKQNVQRQEMQQLKEKQELQRMQLRKEYDNCNDELALLCGVIKEGQGGLSISKSKGEYAHLLPHSLIAFGEGEEQRFYLVINPPCLLLGSTAKVKYLYEIKLDEQTPLTREISPQDCTEWVVKRGIYDSDKDLQAKFAKGERPLNKLRVDLDVWFHELKIGMFATGFSGQNPATFFHIRHSDNPQKPFKPELMLKRVNGPDLWGIYCNLCTEYKGGGRASLLSTVALAIIFLQAVQDIHARNIIHGDITVSNAILDAGLRIVKLTDFANSSVMGDGFLKIFDYPVGSYISYDDWVSAGENTFSSDIYAVGRVLSELFGVNKPGNNRDLFNDHDQEKILGKFTRHEKETRQQFIEKLQNFFGINNPSREDKQVFTSLRNIVCALMATHDHNRITLNDAMIRLRQVYTQLDVLNKVPNAVNDQVMADGQSSPLSLAANTSVTLVRV